MGKDDRWETNPRSSLRLASAPSLVKKVPFRALDHGFVPFRDRVACPVLNWAEVWSRQRKEEAAARAVWRLVNCSTMDDSPWETLGAHCLYPTLLERMSSNR